MKIIYFLDHSYHINLSLFRTKHYTIIITVLISVRFTPKCTRTFTLTYNRTVLHKSYQMKLRMDITTATTIETKIATTASTNTVLTIATSIETIAKAKRYKGIVNNTDSSLQKQTLHFLRGGTDRYKHNVNNSD